eukprot:TRINITY_DN3072_c0_g2_i1.p1 TRINITY_DN3072_c0_g2~~TRINITY_DN3072_c0_g2_i1.p1  ORF type:complete len:297 (+),score=57.83 TRINITY_DN3072_c0_g2_i1:123-893(+)
MPINQVAKELGICATILKKICRRNEIPRWPHRKLKSLEKTIAGLEATLSNKPDESEAIRLEVEALRAKRKEILQKPDLLGKADFQLGLKRGQCLLAARDSFDQQQPPPQRRQVHEWEAPFPARPRGKTVPETEGRQSADSYKPERSSRVERNRCELILSGSNNPNLRTPVHSFQPPHAIALPRPCDLGYRPTAYRPTTVTAPNMLDYSQQLAAFRHLPHRSGSLTCAEYLPALEPHLQSTIPMDFQAIPFGLQLSL